MENNTTKSRGSLKALFLIPSIIGVILFMIPVKNADGDWTVVVKIIADIISGAIGGFLPLLCVIILTVSAVMCLVALGKPKFIMDSPILKECFSCGPIWVVIRVLAAIFVWLTYLGVGSEGTGLVSLITSGDQGGFVLYDLLTTLVIIFVIAAILLPLLLDFGLLEFVGAKLTKVMRPLFKVPGRAAVDCITSWIGDGTLGVMLTCNQYEGGYYTAKEASIIATLFSAVSITFTLVVLDTVGMLDKFGIYYLIVCLVGIVCAIICPYLYPLRNKPDTYLVPGKAAPDTLPEGYKNSTEYGMSHRAQARRAAQGHRRVLRQRRQERLQYVVRRSAHRYGGRYRCSDPSPTTPRSSPGWVCPSSPCWSCSVCPRPVRLPPR